MGRVKHGGAVVAELLGEAGPVVDSVAGVDDRRGGRRADGQGVLVAARDEELVVRDLEEAWSLMSLIRE